MASQGSDAGWAIIKKDQIVSSLIAFRGFLSKYLSVWLALLGVISILIGAANPFELPVKYANSFTSLGSAVLGGGVFGVLLKSKQYAEIFDELLRTILYGDEKEKRKLTTILQDELRATMYGKDKADARGDVLTETTRAFQGVIYGSENETRALKTVFCDDAVKELSNAIKGALYENQLLQQQKDLRELWKTISIAVYSTKYPGISNAIVDKVTEEYFPSDDTFYYEVFQENIIELGFVKPDHKHIETKERIKLRVKPVHPSKPVSWTYVARLFKHPVDSGTKFFLDKLVINGVDRTREYPIQPVDIVDDYGRPALEAALAIDLGALPQYDLYLEVRRIYDYERNRQRDMKSSRFIVRPEFKVAYNPNELELKFLPVGTKETAYTDRAKEGGFSNLIWNEYKDLIFPNQGYTLLLRRKEETS